MCPKIRFFKYLFLIVGLLASCQPKDTFSWNAGLSAPKHYGATGPYVEYYYHGNSIAGASSGTGIDQGWEITSGGYVTLWMQGGKGCTEICRFKANNKGVWKENDPDYNKYINEYRSLSEGFLESRNYWKIHGIPYSVWEKGEKKYSYDIGFSSEEEYKFALTFMAPEYSLPKYFVFSKWQGRELIEFPELDYWQKK